jgi:hypothetical protein
MWRALVLACLLAGLSFAQNIAPGIKGGWMLTQAFPGDPSFSGSPGSKGFLLGPSIEVRLPFGLGVEADALYRRSDILSSQGNSVSREGGGGWEIPVLGKYRFGSPLVKPFVEAGPAFRSGLGSAQNVSGKGFVAGGGIEVGVPRLRISPEIRFLHWGAGGRPSVIPEVEGPNQNQAEFLIGLSF